MFVVYYFLLYIPHCTHTHTLNPRNKQQWKTAHTYLTPYMKIFKWGFFCALFAWYSCVFFYIVINMSKWNNFFSKRIWKKHIPKILKTVWEKNVKNIMLSSILVFVLYIHIKNKTVKEALEKLSVHTKVLYVKNVPFCTWNFSTHCVVVAKKKNKKKINKCVLTHKHVIYNFYIERREIHTKKSSHTRRGRKNPHMNILCIFFLNVLKLINPQPKKKKKRRKN